MQQMQKGKITPSGQILNPKIQPKQLMLRRDLGGRTEEKHKELQNLDPTSSPHLEDILFGGRVDLDLLLQSSKNQRVWVEGLRDLCDLNS